MLNQIPPVSRSFRDAFRDMLTVMSALLLAIPLVLATATQSGRLSEKLVNWTEVPFTQVTIADSFWAPRRETSRKVSLPHSLEMEERDGVVENFRLAATKKTTGFRGLVFSDSDLYKVIESCSYSLATDPDPALDKKIDALIATIAAAQLPDGYVNTWFQVKEPGKRFTNLRDQHEIYCAGHLFEAAVAHHAATKKTNLLNVAKKYADLLCNTFGPGKRMGYCGHPEAELALVKLWRATGEKRYFDLASFMTLSRGSHFFAQEHKTPADKYDGTYWQDDVPIFDHERVKGHAVRHGYLLSAATEIGAQTKDERLLAMVDRVWRNLTERNLYVTGGMGSSASNEGFTKDYDLPNASAYQETCASVAVAMLAHRLNLAYGDAKYADIMETALYNGVLAGVSLDGKKFFYVNPLASEGKHHRSDWFGCACCPPNVTRTLAALGNYAYAKTANGIAVNLFIQGSVKTEVNGEPLEFEVLTDYPYDGKVNFRFIKTPKKQFAFGLRVPAWSSGLTYLLNGAGSTSASFGYGWLIRKFQPGDKVEVTIPMDVRRIVSHPRVIENFGKTAFARGPLVYCFESVDNEFDLDRLAIPENRHLGAFISDPKTEDWYPLLGNGDLGESIWTNGLYKGLSAKRVQVKAVPYALWDNRKPGQMRVWIPTTPPAPRLRGLEQKATIGLSNTSSNCDPEAIRDGKDVKFSNVHPGNLCHWWPRKGTTDDWVSYGWIREETVSSARIFWFDDTGFGECRLPKSWRLTYHASNGQWLPVKLKSGSTYSIAMDKWSEIEFETVATSAMRLEFEMVPGFSVGVHEWQVFAD